jgi:hypothetical protein
LELKKKAMGISNVALENSTIFVDNRSDDAKDGDNWKINVDKHEIDLVRFVAAYVGNNKNIAVTSLILNFMIFINLCRINLWSMRAMEISFFLWNRNAPFFQGFKKTQINDALLRKEIQEIVKLRKELQEAIEKDNMKIVQHFVDKHQTVIIGFNDENVPALSSSLTLEMKTNSFEIYSYLLSKGFIDAGNYEIIKLQSK